MQKKATRQKTSSCDGLIPEKQMLLALFFFSGFPALIYQLVWQRALFRIFGVNIESVTITVTAFMLGLGLGNLAGGLFSRTRHLPPLLVLAGIESLTGIFGYFSLNIFQEIGTLVLGQPLPVTAVVTLALVLIPTLLMGATLPILVAHLVQRSGNVGNSVGQLYYVNTLGAGAVCLIAALLLFPFLGMQKSVDVAVAMNGAVALSALLAFFGERRFPSPAAVARTAHAKAARPVLKLWPTLALAFWGGFISLSYEIFFFRTLSYASGSTPMIFTATLGAFLIGLASGSHLASENCRTDPNTVGRAALLSLLMASGIGFVFLPILSHLGFMKSGVFGVALLLIYLMARFWGLLLPSLAHLGVAADKNAGLRTAWLYLANIFGAASGSIITGFILMDWWGLVDIARALEIAGLSCIVLLALALPLSRHGRLRLFASVAGISLLTLIMLPPLTTTLLESLLWKGVHDATVPFASVVENRSGILVVDKDSTLYGNGAYDGMFNISLQHDTNGIFRPYALSFFHPAPRHVLQIGLATGSWAQIIVNNPDVESLTVVEINPGYLKLISERPEVVSLLRNPKVHIIIDDGRRWLRLHPEQKFDAIIANTMIHFRENASNVLSVEFLELIKSHLNPGGIYFYNTTDSARAQRTGCKTFPYGARFSNHMLVSMEPLAWDMQRWKRTLAAYRIDGQPMLDLTRTEDRAFLDRLDRIADISYISPGKLIEPCADILARTNGLNVITDDNMGTEWRMSLGME